MAKVLIGIQARSGSTRLPRKAFELIAGKMMLDRVIDSCKKAASYISHRNDKHQTELKPKLVILTPKGDEIAREFRNRCDIVEGPEYDVLDRYMIAAERYEADWVVRVTGDCPLLPSFIISKMILLADASKYDYVSNAYEDFRTSLDGSDCEVMTARLLREAADKATDPKDREHVTTWMRRHPPSWAKMGCVINFFDQSNLKLSVDTHEDLARVREAFTKGNDKYQAAMLRFGQTAVHRI